MAGQVLLARDLGKLLCWSHVKVSTMTAEVIAQVNHLGRNKTSLLTFQNRSGEEIGKGNMLIAQTTTATLVRTQTLLITSQE